MGRGSQARPGRASTLLVVPVLALAGAAGVGVPAAAAARHPATPATRGTGAATSPTSTTPPAAPSRNPATPAPPAPGPARLVVLGDSVAAGSACDCPGFGSVVAARQSASLTNEAAAGFTSADLLVQLQSPSVDTALQSATAVVITIGANDFDAAPANDPGCADLSCWATASTQLSTTLDQVMSRVDALVPSTATVVLTGYWNVFLDGAVGAAQGPTYVATSDALTRRVNSTVARVAAAHGNRYADTYTAFKGDGTRDDTTLLAPDGDHPDTSGHRVIAAAVERALTA